MVLAVDNPPAPEVLESLRAVAGLNDVNLISLS